MTMTTTPRERPPFIIAAGSVPEQEGRYPGSAEGRGFFRRVGKAAGLLRLGVNLMRLPPGRRTSFPHAEEKEEEFVYVIAGEVDAWIDGVTYPMGPGDLAAFPAGTGIAHTFINNGSEDATLLVGGDADLRDSRIVYPLNPERRKDMPWSHWWDGAPERSLGPHDGKPDKPGP